MSTINITDIKIGDRKRKALGDIEELAASLDRLGLIHPIVLDQDNNLVAGERRIRAAQHLKWTDIAYVRKDDLSESALREMELEENVRRLDMTWQERVSAVNDLHMLRRRDAVLSGKEWSQKDTGAVIGVSQAFVSVAMALAKRLNDPEVAAKSSIDEAATHLVKEKENAARQELASRYVKPVVPEPGQGELQLPIEAKEIKLSDFLLKADCIEWLAGCEAGSIHHIITDPPYGIDVKMMQQPGFSIDNIEEIVSTHDIAENLSLLNDFAPLAYRVIADRGFLVMWTDQMNWRYLYDILKDVGFSVQRWPLTWVKLHRCQNGAARFNFTKTTECAIVARKSKAILNSAQPLSHWVGSNDANKQGSPFAKPYDLWKWLYDAICVPGDIVLDPFAGSGSSTIPALSMNLQPIALECLDYQYSNLILNVKGFFEKTYGANNVRFI